MQLADTMMTSEHEESEVIGGKLEDMKDCRAKMLEEWELKKKEYDQCMELQLFNRDIEQMETIMVVQEVGTVPFLIAGGIFSENSFFTPNPVNELRFIFKNCIISSFSYINCLINHLHDSPPLRKF